MRKSFILGTVALAASLTIGHAATITLAGDSIGGGQLSGNIFTIGATGTDNGVNNFPGGEPPGAAIDGNAATKYLNFAELFTGYIVTPAVGLSNVTGITFTTANDAPARDPFTFSLYGSTTQVADATPGATFNLADFTAITIDQSTGLETDPGRQITNPGISFTNSSDFTTYLLVFPTLRDAGAENSMQIGDAVLTGTPTPEPSAVLMLASGLGMLGLVRRRRA